MSDTQRTLSELADAIQQWVPTNEMLKWQGNPLTYGEWQQVVAIIREFVKMDSDRAAIKKATD